MNRKDFASSSSLPAAAVALAFGFVVYLGANTASSSLFAIRSPIQRATSIAQAPSTSGNVVLQHTFREATVRESSARAHDADLGTVTTTKTQGLGLPLVLAGLSLMLLGLASWIVRPRRADGMALAAVSAERTNDRKSRYEERYNTKKRVVERTPEVKLMANMQKMMTPLGYYEAYEMVVVLSPKMTDLQKEDRLASLESLFGKNKCKKVEKLDRGRRLLSYVVQGCIEAYVVLYTFKGPRTMPKTIEQWFTGPGLNSDGNVFRCYVMKQRKVMKEEQTAEEEVPMWTV